MFKKCFIGFAFFCASYQSEAQILGFSLAEGKNKVTIPIEIYNNLVVVPVFLNNALPLKFILDTGVRTSILTQKSFSDILNLTYNRKYIISGPGGNKVVEAYVTNNVSLELPGVIGRGHALLVLEEDYLELRNHLGVDVHGILGYELFSRFIVEIDYEKKQLTLMNPAGFRRKRKFQTVPIRIEDTKPYVIAPIVLNDSTKITGKFLIDSGASHGLMLETDSDERIHVPEHVVSSVIGRGLGGEITGKIGRIKSLQFGKYKLADPIANFPDPNSYFDSLKIGATSRNGAIGGETLSRFTVIFNFSREEIYIKKNQSFKKGFHYNLSGVTVRAKGVRLNVFEITSIREKSAGDKGGLQEGDIILSINGLLSSQLNLNAVNAFLNLRPGKKLRMVIDRKGQRLRREVILEDQI